MNGYLEYGQAKKNKSEALKRISTYLVMNTDQVHLVEQPITCSC